MIIGVSGLAGSGKSEVARYLVQHHGFVEVALADPIKRAAMEWFDFSETQLWGPSEERNKPDQRYLQTVVNARHMLSEEGLKKFPDGQVPQYLSPRAALQFLGTEVGRELYQDVWINKAIQTAVMLFQGGWSYESTRGITRAAVSRPVGVVISDVRFVNEVRALRVNGAVIWKIRRPQAGLAGQAGQHASEMEQDSIPEDLFTSTIDNQGSLDDLRKRVRDLLGSYA